MAKHAPEVIDVLDRHWCAKMAEQVLQDPPGATLDESIQKLRELRRAYLIELAGMPKEQVETMAFDVLCEEDLARPFNGFATEADYSHYGRCAFLTAHEAVPLSMGKDPRRVTWVMVHPHLGQSFFANEYANRLDRLERAIIWGELPSSTVPLMYWVSPPANST